jgi:hypothetical protein
MSEGGNVRILIAAAAALLLTGVLLHNTGRSRGAVQAGQASSQVAVVPAFKPTPYPGYIGIPKLPVSAPQLAAYHFTAVPAAKVTTAKLQSFDTVLLYGIRWSDLSASAQLAINTFARTKKVVIWDADDTGAQNYSTFIHAFATSASGENGKANDSVVSFPSGDNFLASPNPSSPYYLDPNQLITDRNMINDMSAMKTGTPGWVPALVAANKNIPNGGWPLAWTYGVIGDHTGLAIYSGIDADAFTDQLNPNYAIKELALQLGAKFLRTPDTSCAPNCQLPGSSGGKPHAACSFAQPLPKGWVHRRVPIVLKTSVAAGITGKVLTRSGKPLAGAREANGLLRFVVRTKRLPSNRASRLRALVYVNGQQACSRVFRLKVDNIRPRLLLLATSRKAGRDLVTLRVSEKSWVTIGSRGIKWPHPKVISAHRLSVLRLPARVRAAKLVVRDRAGNQVVRNLRWR